MIESGVNGLDEKRGDKFAKANLEDLSYSIIKVSELPPQFQDCIKSYRVMGGLCHVYSWVSYSVYGNNNAKKKVDNVAKLTFLKSLVDEGILNPIDDELADMFTDDMQDELLKCERRSALKPHVLQLKEKAERLRRELAEIEAYNALHRTE